MSNPVVAFTNHLALPLDVHFIDDKGGLFMPKYRLGYIDSIDAKKEKLIKIGDKDRLLVTYSGSLKKLGRARLYQFPIKYVTFSGAPGDNECDILEKDETGMVNGTLFSRFFSANTQTAMALNFAQSLSKEQNKEEGMDAFFQNTLKQPEVTYSKWLTLCAWQNQTLSEREGSYYLYALDGDRVEIRASIGIHVDAKGCQATCTLAEGGRLTGAKLDLALADGILQNQKPAAAAQTLALKSVWVDTHDQATGIASGFFGKIGGKDVIGIANVLPEDMKVADFKKWSGALYGAGPWTMLTSIGYNLWRQRLQQKK